MGKPCRNDALVTGTLPQRFVVVERVDRLDRLASFDGGQRVASTYMRRSVALHRLLVVWVRSGWG